MSPGSKSNTPKTGATRADICALYTEATKAF